MFGKSRNGDDPNEQELSRGPSSLDTRRTQYISWPVRSELMSIHPSLPDEDNIWVATVFFEGMQKKMLQQWSGHLCSDIQVMNFPWLLCSGSLQRRGRACGYLQRGSVTRGRRHTGQ